MVLAARVSDDAAFVAAPVHVAVAAQGLKMQA